MNRNYIIINYKYIKYKLFKKTDILMGSLVFYHKYVSYLKCNSYRTISSCNYLNLNEYQLEFLSIMLKQFCRPQYLIVYNILGFESFRADKSF